MPIKSLFHFLKWTCIYSSKVNSGIDYKKSDFGRFFCFDWSLDFVVYMEV